MMGDAQYFIPHGICHQDPEIKQMVLNKEFRMLGVVVVSKLALSDRGGLQQVSRKFVGHRFRCPLLDKCSPTSDQPEL